MSALRDDRHSSNQKQLYGAQRAVAEAEKTLPQFVMEEGSFVPRQRVDLFVGKHPNHEVVQGYQRQAMRVAKARALSRQARLMYEKEMDRLVTYEKYIIMLDAAETP